MNEDNDIDNDNFDRLEQDEKPQVVVLKEGDLTEEQAEAEEKRIQLGKYYLYLNNSIFFY